jgi:hypothetical protein
VKAILHRISKLSIHDTTVEDFHNHWVLRVDLWLDRQIDSDIINKHKRAEITKTTDLFDVSNKLITKGRLDDIFRANGNGTKKTHT